MQSLNKNTHDSHLKAWTTLPSMSVSFSNFIFVLLFSFPSSACEWNISLIIQKILSGNITAAPSICSHPPFLYSTCYLLFVIWRSIVNWFSRQWISLISFEDVITWPSLLLVAIFVLFAAFRLLIAWCFAVFIMLKRCHDLFYLIVCELWLI